MNKDVAIIGAGIAGMTVASSLADMGIHPVLLEKEPLIGGHVKNWDRLFPTRRPGAEVMQSLSKDLDQKADILTGVTIKEIRQVDGFFKIETEAHGLIDAAALILASGFSLFDAGKKEEYGYGIYDNVITSAELETIFKKGQPLLTKSGLPPRRVALIHCVGSRDEKVGNLYCSKVCCVTGVKQGIEIREMIPDSEVYSFYMDLRMYDRHFEELYFEAQQKWGVNFIRGRLSECAENPDHTIVIKTEDTLSGKPMKMTVDMVILLIGFTASPETAKIAGMLGLQTGDDGFILTRDEHLFNNQTNIDGVFVTGAVKGPACIVSTIADARATAMQVGKYLRKVT